MVDARSEFKCIFSRGKRRVQKRRANQRVNKFQGLTRRDAEICNENCDDTDCNNLFRVIFFTNKDVQNWELSSVSIHCADDRR